MKISVVLDCFNYEKYVGLAIRSVLEQTYSDFELIVVDDGSVDGSRKVIESFDDPRIIRIFKTNGGQASALLAGIARATGDYVAFLDSDDLWDPGKLECCVAHIRRYPETVLLSHAFRQIDADGRPTGGLAGPKESGPYDFRADLRALRTDFSLVMTSFFMGRRRECSELSFDESAWRVYADTPIMVGLALRGNALNVKDILGSYRVHGSNLSDFTGGDTAIFEHYRRLYDLVNAELRRQGSGEQFDFLNTTYALNHAILRTKKYSIKGLALRLRKHFRERRGGDGKRPPLES